MPLRKCSFVTYLGPESSLFVAQDTRKDLQLCVNDLNPLSYHTIRFGMHQRQSDLSRDGVWLCADSISFLSYNPWYASEGQEGLAFKVVCPQSVVVQNCHNQACPLSLALIQGYQTAI